MAEHASTTVKNCMYFTKSLQLKIQTRKGILIQKD